ncbi:tetratricopeptide repeat protein [Shewanella surugensis]|uniref:Tetratricopeptide repeat protein n=1 Tax=Shewanella surugensis TaxID=212020 RepID=A0ABT0L9G1_9GAMM|nr:tetratricopeptide repeat protein [Shewanella surugensis]MCL1124353.1 hypothetical protein [Shewanella surugensis]
MMKRYFYTKTMVMTIATLTLFSTATFAAQTSQQAISNLQKEWAVDNYQLKDDAQEAAFTQLMKKADEDVATFSDDAGIHIWRGIIYSTYAGITGGIGALKYAKSAKSDFEKALSLDPLALKGSAYTSLGMLYLRVPGWPIGFGDDDKAQSLLKKGLKANPNGIDANYFYAQYLMEEDEYKQANNYLEKALLAHARPTRPLADKGRREDIQNSLADIKKELE